MNLLVFLMYRTQPTRDGLKVVVRGPVEEWAPPKGEY